MVTPRVPVVVPPTHTSHQHTSSASSGCRPACQSDVFWPCRPLHAGGLWGKNLLACGVRKPSRDSSAMVVSSFLRLLSAVQSPGLVRNSTLVPLRNVEAVGPSQLKSGTSLAGSIDLHREQQTPDFQSRSCPHHRRAIYDSRPARFVSRGEGASNVDPKQSNVLFVGGQSSEDTGHLPLAWDGHL